MDKATYVFIKLAMTLPQVGKHVLENLTKFVGKKNIEELAHIDDLDKVFKGIQSGDQHAMKFFEEHQNALKQLNDLTDDEFHMSFNFKNKDDAIKFKQKINEMVNWKPRTDTNSKAGAQMEQFNPWLVGGAAAGGGFLLGRWSKDDSSQQLPYGY